MTATPGKAKERPEQKPNKPTATTATQPLGQPTGWRKWLYRLAAVTVVPTALFGLLELGLRVIGYGYPTSFFLVRPGPGGKGTIYAENLDFGRRFFPPGLLRKPLTLAVPTVKTKGTYRIFVLGESAAMGFPDPSSSFARILEVMLREAYPDTHFEVVNTAMTAINSHVVLPIARECAGHQPDLFVVHLGNNEVIGTFGAAGVLGSYSPSLCLLRTSLAIKTTRTGQLLGNILRGLSPREGRKSWDGMEMYQKSWVSADDPRLEGTLANFRQNLHDIGQAGVAAGAKVIVCTIPVNLKDSAPFASLHAPDLSADRTAAWEKSYQDGISLEKAGKLAEALRRYEQAAAVDDRYADLHFRMARCCLSLGKSGQARQHYLLARDLDALRFRSDTRINDTIRDVVASLPAGVQLVDAEKDFAAISPSGVPGEELFLEHVHMNFKGNHALAASVFRTIAKILPLDVLRAQAGAPEPASEQQCADRLAHGAWNRFEAESTIRAVLYDPPFNQQLDHSERAKQWDARLDALRASLQPEKMKEEAAIFQKALQHAPHDWMIRENHARFLAESGAMDQAWEQYNAIVQQVPHHCTAFIQMGKLRLKGGNLEGAKVCFEAALSINPDDALTHYDLAAVLAAEGKVEEALALFTKTVDKQYDRVQALALLANFLLNLGKQAEARQRLDEAFQIDPENATAHIIMGHLLSREGATAEAVSHYEAAIRSRPGALPTVTRFLDKLRKAQTTARPPGSK